uniref:Transposase, MuDR, MULE transposase domain protein n=1 Tax=Tanacetum cinerariifolium TaxID=118510 RepID=A0A6L2P2E8_TANCI|nr:transposase, MuDR, MULE transposase domain protein [Tanacetum cinerariifolium]
MYVSGRVDIFDIVDIDLFTLVALNMMVLKLGYTGKSETMFYNYIKPLTSLDEGLYALACEEDVRCLGTLVRSFKLIEVYIEHSVIALDSYLRAPQFRATLKEITYEPDSIAANKTKFLLLLTWHESSEITKEPICESVTPSSLPQHDSKVSTEVPIVEEVRTQEFNVKDVVLEDYVSSGEDGEDAEHDDDDDVDEDFLIDEENEIVEPDVDVHFFGISMDLPFDNIGITNLVSGDALEGDDADVINADDFDSVPGNDEEKKKVSRIEDKNGSKRNLKLYKNDGVRIRARCDGKVPVFTMPQVQVVQDQLQRELEVQISMSKAFRAKDKAEREIRGDHVLQYSMLRDYVVELQSTNLNTTVKIAVERNNDPFLPTRVF